MRNSLSPMRRSTFRGGARRLFAAVTALTLLAIGCGEPTGPTRSARGTGTLAVSAVMNAVTATTLVLEIAGPDITPTLVYNLPVVNGVASGTVTIPAGADRQITARAFDGQTETHRGTRTQTIVAGTNPSVAILLIPLQGQLPITVTLGSLVVTVTPNTASPRVGDTVQFAANVVDVNGQAASFPVAWASTDTRVALIEPSGRAIMVGAGTAQIVATTNGAAGTAALTVSPAVGPAPAAYLRTWVGGAGTGSQRNDWAFANNWSPAQVPTFQDSVVIGNAAFQPSIQTPVDTFRLRDLVLQPGANLQLSFRTLTVTGGVLAGLGGTVQNNGQLRLVNGARVRGTIGAPVLATGGTTIALADTARLVSLTVDGTSTVFDVNGRPLILTAPGTSTGLNVLNGAVFQMDQATDSVDITGLAYFQSSAASHQGALTAGQLVLRSNLQDGFRFNASGTHTTLFAGTASQVVSNMDASARPGNGFQQVRVTGTGGLNLCSPTVRVLGTFSVEAVASVTHCTSWTLILDGALATVSGSTFTPYSVVLNSAGGTAGVAGTFSPQFTTFSAASATVRFGLAYQSVTFTQSASITDSVRMTGTLTVTGTGVSLDFASPRPVRLGGLVASAGATFRMADPADTVIVSGGLDVNGASDLETLLSAGVLAVSGDVQGSRFGSSGTHVLRLTGGGPGAQSVNGFDQSSRPANILQNLELANTGGTVSFCSPNLRIRGLLRVGTPTTVINCTTWFTRVDGDLQTVAGSTVQTYGMTLANATGTSGVNGTWSPTFTDFAAPNAPVRSNLAYQNLRFYAANRLLGATTTTGELLSTGVGTVVLLNGNRVTVGGAMRAQTGASFTIADGDTVAVAGDLDIQSAGTNPTGGQISVRGNVNLAGYIPTAGGTHRLVFNGTALQNVSTQNTLRVVPRIENRNTTAPVQLSDCCAGVVASDSLIVQQTGASLTGISSSYWGARQALVQAAGTTISGPFFNLENSATLANVLGTFAPTTVRLYGSGTGPGSILRDSVNIQPTNVEFYTSYTLSRRLTVSGYVQVNAPAAVLTFNGQKVTAFNFDLTNGGTASMVNALDSLVVGNGTPGSFGVTLDGGTAMNATAGTIIIRNGQNTFTNFTGSGTNTIIFTDTGLAPSARTFDVNSNLAARHVRVVGQSGLTVFLRSQTNTVSDTLFISGGTLTSFNTGYGIALGAGSRLRMTGGALTQMYVNLADASGTSQVAPAASFDPGITRFTALGAQINPTITYRFLETYASTSLLGNMTVTGSMAVLGGALTLAGRKVTLGNIFDLTGGTLVMSQPGDSIDAGGDVYIDGGPGNTLSDGVIIVRGTNFNGTNYVADDAGTAKVLFAGTGTGQQLLAGNTRFRRLEVAGNRGLFLQSQNNVVTDSFTVSTAVPVGSFNTAYGMEVLGPLTVAAATSFNNMYLRLRHPSGTNLVAAGTTLPGTDLYLGSVAPNFTPDTIGMNPGVAYGNVFINSEVRVRGATSAANLTVSGGTRPRFVFNGNRVTLSGGLTVATGGRLVMGNAADSLVTGGSVSIQASSSTSDWDLSAGTMVIGGNVGFEQAAASASGTHRVVLRRDDATLQDVFTPNGLASLQNLEIAGNGSRTIRFNANNASVIRVNGNLQVTSPAAAITLGMLFNDRLQVLGTLSTTAATTITFPTQSLQLDGSAGTSGILGPATIGTLIYGGSAQGQVLPVAGGNVTYSNFQLPAGATASTPAGVSRIGTGPAGNLNVAGTLTIPSGSTLDVCGSANSSVAGAGIISIGGAMRVRAPGPLAFTGTFPGILPALASTTTGC